MSNMRQEILTSEPAIHLSHTPSEVPEAMLPFGSSPILLVEKESTAPPMSENLRRRVRVLVDNANEVKYAFPIKASMCWHEAGRLLDRHVGRLAEAWICYSRAVALFPEHKPSLAALRRLARLAGASQILAEVIETSIQRTTNTRELAGLHTELAVLAIERGDTGEALDALRESLRSNPKAVAAQIIKIGVSVNAQDDEELMETLVTIVENWDDSQHGKEFVLILTLLEERLGKLDSAFERMQKESKELHLGHDSQWAFLRLCLRLNHTKEAIDAADRLVQLYEKPDLKKAFKRIRGALMCLLIDHPDVNATQDLEDDDPVWDLETLSASGKEHRKKSAAAALKLIAQMRNPALSEAVALSRVANSFSPGIGEAKLDSNIEPLSIHGRALASFMGLFLEMETTPGEATLKQTPFSAQIQSALSDNDWEKAANVLALLRERSSDETDRWGLVVAESAIRIEHLGGVDNALQLLRNETENVGRKPLPELIRAFDSISENLATLAIVEARNSEDEEFQAWRFAWAGHHLESSERREARRLYQRALNLSPELQFAIEGLDRTVSDKRVLAEACLNGALVTRDTVKRVRFLIRSAFFYMFDGSGLRAAELFAEALDITPDDELLREAVLRLALAYPSIDVSKQIEYEEEAASKKDIGDVFVMASLAFNTEPAIAVKWFERALEKAQNDPVALYGLEKSQLRSGRAADVSTDLLAKLRSADNDRVEAATYMRLAHIDRFYGKDVSSSILSLGALNEKLPGHRSTLVRLVTYYLLQRNEEISRYLIGLAKTVLDEDDFVALITAAWRSPLTPKEPLRLIVGKKPSAFLETAQLEGVTTDPQLSIALLENLTEGLHHVPVYVSRLAERLGEFGYPEKAVEHYKRLFASKSATLFELYCLSVHQRRLGDIKGLLNTLRCMAEESSILEYRVGFLWEAVDIARTRLQDLILASQLCIQILSIAPQDENAYRLGLHLLVNGDPGKYAASLYQTNSAHYGLLIDLMMIYLNGLTELEQKSEHHQNIALVLLSSGRGDLRKEALQHIHESISIIPENIVAFRWLANLYCEDQNWDKATEQLIAAARIVRDPIVGCEVFFQLGVLYMDYINRYDLAEKCFIKVLGWDRSHFDSMERIGEIYLRTGKISRAAQAVEHLIRLAQDIPTRIRKMVLLAELKKEYLDSPKDAERILCEARRIDPFALEPVEALADFFKSQRDPLALSVQLDSALASQASLLVDQPDNVQIYHAIHRILTLRGEHNVAAIATEAIALAEGTYSVNKGAGRFISWDIGSRVGDSSYDEFICPQTIPSGLRQTLRILGEPLARQVGVSAKQMNIDKDKRLDRRNYLAQMMTDMATAFRVPSPSIYVGSDLPLRIAPGSPSIVIVSPFIAQTRDMNILRFVCSHTLKMASLGVSLVTIVPVRKLRLLLSAVVRMAVPNYEPEGINIHDLLSETARLQQTLPARTVSKVRPFVFDCMEALKQASFGDQLMTIGYRAGFLGAGSLPGAIKVLRVFAGLPTGPLADVPGAGQLMSFVFSRNHIELRTRMGI